MISELVNPVWYGREKNKTISGSKKKQKETSRGRQHMVAREQQVCHKEIRVELLDKEELLEVCKQETFLIKSGVRKITQVGVHKTN